jgi:glycerol kinase
MPVRRYVEQGVVFTPEVLSAMSRAFTAAIEALEIGGDEMKREAVAQCIVQLAQEDGALDAAALRDRAIAALGDSVRAGSIGEVRETLDQPEMEATSAQPLAWPAQS